MGLFQGPEKLAHDLVQGLEYCYLANTLGSIFLHQPITYPLFFPEALVKRQPGKELGTSATKKQKAGEGTKKEGQKGAIINTTGMALSLRGLRGTYCRTSWIQTILAGLVQLVHLYTLRYLRVSYLKTYLSYGSWSRILSVLVGLLR